MNLRIEEEPTIIKVQTRQDKKFTISLNTKFIFLIYLSFDLLFEKIIGSWINFEENTPQTGFSSF